MDTIVIAILVLQVIGLIVALLPFVLPRVWIRGVNYMLTTTVASNSSPAPGMPELPSGHKWGVEGRLVTNIDGRYLRYTCSECGSYVQVRISGLD